MLLSVYKQKEKTLSLPKDSAQYADKELASFKKRTLKFVISTEERLLTTKCFVFSVVTP